MSWNDQLDSPFFDEVCPKAPKLRPKKISQDGSESANEDYFQL